MTTKSINCASCGAGLTRVILDHAKCCYCGNTNKVFNSGITKVVDKPKTNYSNGGRITLTTGQKIMMVGLVMLMPIFLYKFIRK